MTIMSTGVVAGQGYRTAGCIIPTRSLATDERPSSASPFRPTMEDQAHILFFTIHDRFTRRLIEVDGNQGNFAGQSINFSCLSYFFY
jgi:hypothetical protein